VYLMFEVNGNAAYEMHCTEDLAEEIARRVNLHTADVPQPVCDCVPDSAHPSEMCGVMSSAGRVCTKPTGHPGTHRACGGETHNIAEWLDDQIQEPTR
jgi:hypothetical protein